MCLSVCAIDAHADPCDPGILEPVCNIPCHGCAVGCEHHTESFIGAVLRNFVDVIAHQRLATT